MGSAPTATTTQSGQQTTQPWAPAIPALTNMLNTLQGSPWNTGNAQGQGIRDIGIEAAQIPTGFGAQGSALTRNLFGYNTQPQQGLLRNAYGNATGDITGAVGGASNLLGSNYANTGGFLGNAYNTAQGALSPYLQSNFLNPQSNPYLQPTLNAIGQQAQQATDSLFAAAGRDPAGNAQAAKATATAMANAEAPYLMNQFNTNAQLQQGAAGLLGNLGLGVGSTVGQLGLGTGGTLGNLGISEGGTLGNLGLSTASGLTDLQQAGQQSNLEGVRLAEGLPGLYTMPGQAMLQAGNLQANAPFMNLPGIESLLNPIAGLGNSMNYFGTGQTQYPQSTFSNILGGGLGLLSLGLPGPLSGGSFGGNILSRMFPSTGQ